MAQVMSTESLPLDQGASLLVDIVDSLPQEQIVPFFYLYSNG